MAQLRRSLQALLSAFALFLVSLALPLSLSATQLTDSQTNRLELYYGLAQGNYLIGDLRGANRGIEQMLRIDPDYLPALTLQSRVKLDSGEPFLALESAEHAIELAPDELEYQLLKALILGNLARRDEAIALIEQVMQQAPIDSNDYRVASKLLGLLLMAEGDWDAAADTFNDIYLANPETAAISLELASEAYLEKARNALKHNENDAAIDAISEALAVHESQTGEESLKQRTALRMMRARVLTQIGRLDEAIQDLQYITGQQPDNFEALVTLASLYASAERWESLNAIIKPLSQNPALEDITLYLKGRASLALNRIGTARENFEAAIVLLPDGPSKLRASLHFYRGICLQKLGRTDEAESEILTALDSDFRPENAQEGIIASRALLRANQPKRAIDILEAIALNQISGSATTWTLLGRAHLAENTVGLALSAFNQSLSIQPDQADVRALRGSLLRKIGDLRGAAADYQSAQEIEPENTALTYELGLVRFQQGKLDDATQQIAQAAQQLPNNPGIQLLYALLAYNTDQPDTARTALQAYLTLSSDTPNESAYYLEYALAAPNDPEKAHAQLTQRTQQVHATPELKNYLAYTQGTLDRKAALDHAGKAETPELAQQQITEAAYWMAQHTPATGQQTHTKELLKIAIQIGHPDLPEYQFAKWQLRRVVDIE